ncbi:hypothetical protein [Methanolobus profundi]|uniref:Uncharacterized protein n=1 Tax=Methanolobus profundi TaxID=487685 RepID=A0A1I4UPX9_9EURY|nr:hypothetical protein [Methanolobus profundi]SFM90783.1 hypothetical protein SAMN04488696_2822 [Methanolobus profundi]
MSLLDVDFEQFLSELLYALLYPLEVIFRHLTNIIQIIIGAFVGLISSLFTFFNSVYSMISTFVSLWMPSVWIILILIMLGIAFVLRIYWFLKDIEILGNKI